MARTFISRSKIPAGQYGVKPATRTTGATPCDRLFTFPLLACWVLSCTMTSVCNSACAHCSRFSHFSCGTFFSGISRAILSVHVPSSIDFAALEEKGGKGRVTNSVIPHRNGDRGLCEPHTTSSTRVPLGIYLFVSSNPSHRYQGCHTGNGRHQNQQKG